MFASEHERAGAGRSPGLPPAVEVARLDVSEWFTDRAGFAERFGRTLERTGFCIIRNHGVAPAVVEEAFAASRELFALGSEVKRSYARPAIFHQRGFVPYAEEKYPGQPADRKEMWHIGRESEYGNVWPAEAPRFRQAMSTLYQALDAAAVPLLQACAEYLGEPRELLSDMAREGRSLLRVAYYPAKLDERSSRDDAGAQWVGAHTDINFLTLLCPATVSGLEVQARNGVWVPVDAGPGELIVNVADMLQNVTNGVFLSGLHRVRNPEDPTVSRISIPFFIHPRKEIDLSPLSSCIARVGKRDERCRNLTAAEYLSERLLEISLAK